MGNKAAGRQVLCTHRRVTPALGARLLRSYVPLRYGPSESGCDNNNLSPGGYFVSTEKRNLFVLSAFWWYHIKAK